VKLSASLLSAAVARRAALGGSSARVCDSPHGYFRIARPTVAAMTSGKFQLSAIRGGVEVLCQRFGDRGKADEAVAEALVRYRDCEIRLTEGRTTLISVAAARAKIGAIPLSR
jgi:hypothetical protein